MKILKLVSFVSLILGTTFTFAEQRRYGLIKVINLKKFQNQSYLSQLQNSGVFLDAKSKYEISEKTETVDISCFDCITINSVKSSGEPENYDVLQP